MDLREKLIELLQNDDCPLLYVFGENMGRLADYLIENGVTVQEWVPVTERLPELSGEYLVYCGEYDGICVLYYEIKKTKGKWRSQLKEVTHWMPLPEPPKES